MSVSLSTRVAHIADIGQLEADIAIRLVRPSTGDLIIRKLGSFSLGVFGHRDYLAARPRAALSSLDWITWDAARSQLPEMQWFERHVGVEPRLRCNRILSILAAARAGVGVALLGRGAARSFRELVELPCSLLPSDSMPLWLARPAVHQHDPLINAVARWLVDLADQSLT